MTKYLRYPPGFHRGAYFQKVAPEYATYRIGTSSFIPYMEEWMLAEFFFTHETTKNIIDMIR
jgi:hypothetical protein